MPVSLVHLPFLKFIRGSRSILKKTQEKIAIHDSNETDENDEDDDLSIE